MGIHPEAPDGDKERYLVFKPTASISRDSCSCLRLYVAYLLAVFLDSLRKQEKRRSRGDQDEIHRLFPKRKAARVALSLP